jgi:hypothetical protein
LSLDAMSAHRLKRLAGIRRSSMRRAAPGLTA